MRGSHLMNGNAMTMAVNGLSRVLLSASALVFLSGCGASMLGGSGGSSGSSQSVTASSPDAVVGEFVEQSNLGELTVQDLTLAREAQFNALSFSEAGQPIAWRNSDTGVYGEVTPAQVYTVNASTCRDFTHLVFKGQETSEKRGTACQGETGSWRVLS